VISYWAEKAVTQAQQTTQMITANESVVANDHLKKGTITN
jgi:hypothetical protein